jgi:N-acetyl sugar amidotransferase
MNRCDRCLIPDTRPDTAFVNGVCSACLNHDAQQQIDWKARKGELIALLDRHKGKGPYDCIVASSGGKDSTAQVMKLLELGARPLIVTATTCMLTDLGRRNIDNLKRYASTIEVTPNQLVRAKLNLLGLTLVGDVSWPEHVAIFTTPIRIAVALGIPLVFYGENPQAAYGGPLGTEDAKQMTRRWVSEFGGFLGLRPSDMIGWNRITRADMAEYEFPTDAAIEKAGVEAHFLGQYLRWNSRENAQIAEDAGMEHELPFEGNWWPWENLDNAMTGLHDYMMYKKYGYGRACAQLSVDIRNGDISRSEAEKILGRREGLFPTRYAGVSITQVCDRLGINRKQLDMLIDKFTSEKYKR